MKSASVTVQVVTARWCPVNFTRGEGGAPRYLFLWGHLQRLIYETEDDPVATVLAARGTVRNGAGI
jgi:hypothetical protein